MIEYLDTRSWKRSNKHNPFAVEVLSITDKTVYPIKYSKYIKHVDHEFVVELVESYVNNLYFVNVVTHNCQQIKNVQYTQLLYLPTLVDTVSIQINGQLPIVTQLSRPSRVVKFTKIGLDVMYQVRDAINNGTIIKDKVLPVVYNPKTNKYGLLDHRQYIVRVVDTLTSFERVGAWYRVKGCWIKKVEDGYQVYDGSIVKSITKLEEYTCGGRNVG